METSWSSKACAAFFLESVFWVDLSDLCSLQIILEINKKAYTFFTFQETISLLANLRADYDQNSKLIIYEKNKRLYATLSDK
jgi:hypothetical protein